MIESGHGARGEARIGGRDARGLQSGLQHRLRLELCRRVGLDAVAAALGVTAEAPPARTGRRIPAIVVRKGRAA